MKKFITTLMIFTSTALCASAATLTGTALTNFSTEEPTHYFTVKLDQETELTKDIILPAETILSGRVVEVENGRRGKRGAYFVFTPTTYSNETGTFEFRNKNIDIKVSQYKPLDKGETAKSLATSGATTVASHVLRVPLLSEGVSFVKGIAKPQDASKNRITNGFTQVYKDSPLSYVEKGEELNIVTGQQIKLKISEEEVE